MGCSKKTARTKNRDKKVALVRKTGASAKKQQQYQKQQQEEKAEATAQNNNVVATAKLY